MNKATMVLFWVIVSAVLVACATTNHSQSPAVVDDRYEPQPYVTLEHPEWTRSATIYQVNTRQFSEEGTFAAVQRELPRLKDLGIDILWLMPIHPIGVQNRKGTLGSPYSVRDYFGVNPEFGTLDDLKALVRAAHALDMYVILDWVANHTAWDNPMRDDHPDWYERDYKGDFRPTPWWDWSDIIDLDYSQPELRRYMTEAMKYWVREADIDGYRCDVAGFVPVDFWENVRGELDEIKPVFMLAEWESRDLHAQAFDATYAWSWYETVYEIVNGKATLDKLFVYYSWRESAYPKEAFRLVGISNHDVNAWEHTPMQAFGAAMDAVIVLSVVGDGIPMIYNGQEAGNEKQLAFFEKDPIEWREHPTGDLYRKLFALKKVNTALWNGQWGATMVRIWNSAPNKVLSFVRENEQDKVFALINFSPDKQSVTLLDGPFGGTYRDYFSGESFTVSADTELVIPPWGYRVLVQ
ncbi:MAG: alpha-amylase family glycosyl hydrolase [Woeseiaceae bacterium]|jgi:glycosidase